MAVSYNVDPVDWLCKHLDERGSDSATPIWAWSGGTRPTLGSTWQNSRTHFRRNLVMPRDRVAEPPME